MIRLKDNQVLMNEDTYNFGFETVEYIGKKEGLIAHGFATEEMLTLDPINNGFGITRNEHGHDVMVYQNYWENYWGPGVWKLEVYPTANVIDRPTEKGLSPVKSFSIADKPQGRS